MCNEDLISMSMRKPNRLSFHLIGFDPELFQFFTTLELHAGTL